MIKTIFFDFDGVLTLDKNDGFTVCTYIAKQAGIDYAKLNATYPNPQRLYAGRATYEDIWPEFEEALGQKIDIKLVYDSFQATPRNEAMITLAKSLKSAGYAVGIITNQTVERYEGLRKLFGLDEFDPVVVSAAVGVTKGGEFGGQEIFKVALAKHSNTPDEAVFIDNTETNLVIPKQMGMHTIYHDDAVNDMTKLEAELRDLGLSW